MINFHEAIEPPLAELVRLTQPHVDQRGVLIDMSSGAPRVIVSSVEGAPDPTPELAAAGAFIEDRIRAEAVRFGLSPPPLPETP